MKHIILERNGRFSAACDPETSLTGEQVARNARETQQCVACVELARATS